MYDKMWNERNIKNGFSYNRIYNLYICDRIWSFLLGRFNCKQWFCHFDDTKYNSCGVCICSFIFNWAILGNIFLSGEETFTHYV